MTTTVEIRPQVAQSLRRAPVIGVVRTGSFDEAARQARLFAESGIELVEITFTVPKAHRVLETVADRLGEKVLLGAGTVLDPRRVQSPAEDSDAIENANVAVEFAEMLRNLRDH